MKLSVGFVCAILCGLAAAQLQLEVGYSPGDTSCNRAGVLSLQGADGACVRVTADSINVGVISDCNSNGNGGTLTLYTNPSCSGSGDAQTFQNGDCLPYSADEINADEDLSLQPSCVQGGGGLPTPEPFPTTSSTPATTSSPTLSTSPSPTTAASASPTTAASASPTTAASASPTTAASASPTTASSASPSPSPTSGGGGGGGSTTPTPTTGPTPVPPTATPTPTPTATPVCFADDAQVRLIDGSVRPLRNVEVGDLVQSYDDKGRSTFSEVFLVQHAGVTRRVAMRRIEFSAEHEAGSITVSGGHYLDAGEHGRMVRADELAVGDAIYVIGRDGSRAKGEVQSVSTVYAAPRNVHTMNDRLVVDGVLATPFTEVEFIGVNSMRLRALLLPLKGLYLMGFSRLVRVLDNLANAAVIAARPAGSLQ